ncbi:hypothetical protein OCOL_000705 [Ordospora colligata]|nr:hypothetical protein CWI40_090010 [Ordospora colligata]TBU16710.1 hypothetical protein CWI41_020010 [Ordospora colligata]TBU17016.1 hypothetical protein CWI40_020010 [Ordospora colligata]TBU17597.1 hypothetical protein CWI40_012530 [Ordospora colligata]
MNIGRSSTNKDALMNEIDQYEQELSEVYNEKKKLREEELNMLPYKICKMRKHVFEMEDAHAMEVDRINQTIISLNSEQKALHWQIKNNKSDIEHLEMKYRWRHNDSRRDTISKFERDSYIRKLSDLKMNEGELNQKIRDINRRVENKERNLRNKVEKYNNEMRQKNQEITNIEESCDIPENELMKINEIRERDNDVDLKICEIKENIEKKKADLSSEIEWVNKKRIIWIVFYVLFALFAVALTYLIIYDKMEWLKEYVKGIKLRNNKKHDDTWIDNKIDNQIDNELHGENNKACGESTVLHDKSQNDQENLLTHASDSQPCIITDDQAANYIHSYDANLNQVVDHANPSYGFYPHQSYNDISNQTFSTVISNSLVSQSYSNTNDHKSKINPVQMPRPVKVSELYPKLEGMQQLNNNVRSKL